MSSSRYFISGGCGFLGQHVVQALHDAGPTDELRVFDLHPRPTMLAIETLPSVRIIAGDLRRPETFGAELAGVDTVIHCAGKVTFKGNAGDPADDVNVVGTRNLLQAAIEHGCRSFIFISSISAVGMKAGQISDETFVADEEVKRLGDGYGYGKLLCESALVAEKERIRTIILNPSVILGPGSPVIERLARWVRWVPALPMLDTTNSFVDVRDVAQAVVLALNSGSSGERYLVTAENVDNVTLMALAMGAMGKRAPVFAMPRSLFTLYDGLVWLAERIRWKRDLKRSAEMVVDKAFCSAKIRREMGWQPAYTLEETVRHILATPPQ